MKDPREQAREIAHELFHTECQHEWRTRGHTLPVSRNECGDCTREAIAAALAEAQAGAGATDTRCIPQPQKPSQDGRSLCLLVDQAGHPVRWLQDQEVRLTVDQDTDCSCPCHAPTGAESGEARR